jgi:putative spermidine/putrescine transport system permease protein
MPRIKTSYPDFRIWLIVPSILLITLVMVIPVGLLLMRGFTDPTPGLQNFKDIFTQALYAKVALNTVAISASVTALTLLLGYPLAYIIAHSSASARKILMLVILVPLWTSLLVRSFAWMVLLQDNGLINDTLMAIGLISEPLALIYNRTGVLIAITQVMLPLMVLPLYSVMSRIDKTLPKAATTLGASPLSAFFKIYVPLSIPGIVSGCTLVFVLCLGYYITPALVGGRGDLMIGQLIVLQIGEIGNWGAAGALSLSLLIGTFLVLAPLSLLSRRQRKWMGQ